MGIHSTLSLDAMSGDLGAEVVVRASAKVLQDYRNVDLVLAGDEAVLGPLIDANIADALRGRIRIQHATEVVGMAESPAESLRKKKDSSMRVALDLVKDGNADACVSAGNTGALMATARFVLKMLPGIDRPAILVELPAMGGSIHMLDVGANTTADDELLFQYAVMGSIVCSDLRGIKAPRIALLNIGTEDIKGSDTIKTAAKRLTESNLNYVGFIEGSTLFSGDADVVVTDGFTGNVALKTMEGTVGLATYYLRRAFGHSLLSRLQALLAGSVLRRLSSEMDSRHYNGATLAGLNGIVIKSHGSADEIAFEQAIRTAIVEVRNQLPQQIGAMLQEEA